MAKKKKEPSEAWNKTADTLAVEMAPLLEGAAEHMRKEKREEAQYAMEQAIQARLAKRLSREVENYLNGYDANFSHAMEKAIHEGVSRNWPGAGKDEEDEDEEED